MGKMAMSSTSTSSDIIRDQLLPCDIFQTWRGWSRVTSSGSVAPTECTDGDGGAAREIQRCSAGRDLAEMQCRSPPVDPECASRVLLVGRWGRGLPASTAAGEGMEPTGSGSNQGEGRTWRRRSVPADPVTPSSFLSQKDGKRAVRELNAGERKLCTRCGGRCGHHVDGEEAAARTAFVAAVGTLLNATADYTVTNLSRRFATGQEGFNSSNPTIYGLTQCTPDLSPADCPSCLGSIISSRTQFLNATQGGRIIGIRCNFRYEVYPFFSGNTTLRLPAEVNVTPSATPPG